MPATTSPTHATRRILTALAAGAVALAACGGDDDDGAAAPTPATAAGGATTAADPAPTTAPSGDATTSEPATTASPTTTTAAPTTTTTGPRAPTRHEVAADPEPAALAAVVVAAEAAIHDPATAEADVAAWALAQQTAYRVVGDDPTLLPAVVAELPPDLQAAATANATASEQLFGLVTPRPALPDWRIETPPPPAELLAVYQAAADAEGLDWTYLAAIHLVETRMGRIRGLSEAGAQGPMQFLPSTWEAYGAGGDIEDPGDAIHAAARYLRAAGAPDDMDGALFAYNHSDRYVMAVQAYASVMRADPSAYTAYWHWQVFYRLEGGDVVLPEGWEPGRPTA
jgi:membrane-bound lytic murein transglycosylase B